MSTVVGHKLDRRRSARQTGEGLSFNWLRRAPFFGLWPALHREMPESSPGRTTTE